MPVALRSRVKTEIDGNQSSSELSNSPKPISRRTKRRKRNSEDDQDDDFVGSDGNSAYYHGDGGNSRPFEMVGGLPSSSEISQYNSALAHPLSVKDSAVLYDSLVSSRKTWVRGEMFELYFTKPVKTTKDVPVKPETPAEAMSVQVRDKMQKMCDCTMFGGPHAFPVRLFILKNEEMEKKWQEEQDMKKKEKEDRRKREKEERQKRVEMKKQQQLKKKQEKERLIQLQKENKVKGKMELEAVKQKRKDEIRKFKEKLKRTQMNTPAPSSQSVTDPKMITNLNLMAQRDPKLNALMGIVANGDATLDQVEEFKKFIEIAKKMPTPPGWTPPQPRLTEQTRVQGQDSNVTNAGKATQSDTSAADHADKKPTADSGVKQIVQEKVEIAGAAVKAEREIKQEMDAKATREINERMAKLDDKSMHLTTFQQKYSQGAQIVLEYLEFTTSRYLLPKKSIVEFLEDEETFIVSWVMVHNAADIRRHKSKRIRELCKNLKTEDEKKKLAEDYDVLTERGCPTPLYTPMTVKFTGIHRKFAGILRNSVDPVEQVQKEMTAILEIGTRLSGYNLWYQLDAYDDRDLAERLRVELNEHEQESKGKKRN